MKLLRSYLREYRGLVALALLLTATNQVFSMLDPLIFRHVIDTYATRYDEYTTGEFLRGVLWLLGAAVGVAFVSRVAKNLQDYTINVITQRLGARLYADGIRRSLELPYQTFEDQRSGETLGRLQKVRSDVEKLVTQAINVLFQTLIGIVFVTIYSVSVHWAIAPAFFATIPLLGLLSSLLSRRIKTIQKQIVAETTALAGSTTESLRNIELVKSLGLAQQEIGRLNRTTDRILDLELRKVRHLRSLSFIQGTSVNLLRTCILFLMLYLIYAQQISVGQFFSLFIYSFFIFGPLQEIGNVINTWREAEVSLDHFAEILDPGRAPPGAPHAPGSVGAARLRGGVFHPPDRLSARARRCELLAGAGRDDRLRGPLGLGQDHAGEIDRGAVPPRAGADLLQRDRPRPGRARRPARPDRLRDPGHPPVLGHDPREPAVRAPRRQRCGVPGRAGAGCLPVAAAAGRAGARHADRRGRSQGLGGRAAAAVDRPGAAAPAGAAGLRRGHFGARLDHRGGDLSHTIRDVGSGRDRLTILIAHRLSTVLHADRIYVLERGRIVESGRHSELVEHKGLYYAMWRQQVGERRSGSPAPAAVEPAAAHTS